MAVISWGKPTIEIAPLGAGDVPGAWLAIDTPKLDSSQLNTEAGNKTEALEEGGGVVDTKYDKSKYTFKCQLFAKKEAVKPIVDEDGRVLQNYAVRLIPEDPTLEGWIMERTSVSVVETWSSADGKLWEYTFEGLVPLNGNILKPYTAPAA
jgi:hypothetical protein